MSYQEKSIYVSLISTLLVLIYSLFKLYFIYQSGTLDASSVINLVLTIVMVMIVVSIISHILFNIINKIATDEDEPSVTDELDKLIDLKATRNAHYVFMICFMLTILGTLLVDISMLVMFILVFFYMITSCVIGDISKLYLYKKGV